ncbi:MAG: chemotaxis protein CheA [Pseudomonadota bacterium]
MDDSLKEFVGEFVSECLEMVEEIEPKMISASALNQDLANNMFRPIHSMKGSSASLGFNNLAKAVHSAENLLSLFRSGEYTSTEHKYLQYFLDFFDFTRKCFKEIDSNLSDEAMAPDSLKVQEAAELLKNDLAGNPTKTPAQASVEPVIDLCEANPAAAEKGKKKEDEDKMEIDQEMIDSFMAESLEAIAFMEEGLLALKKDPSDKNLIKDIYRYMHSFKGNCGIFSLHGLGKLAHRMESLLDAIASGQVPSGPSVFETIIPIIDVLRERVEKLGPNDKGEVQGLDLYLEILDNCLANKKLDGSQSTPAAPVKVVPPKEIKAAATPEKKSEGEDASARKDIRVDLNKLEALNNLVGELVTVKTMIAKQLRLLTNEEKVDKTYRFLDRVVGDLQDVSMSIRMIPISGLFRKMIRIVHDISVKSKKEVDFKFFGEETEIDKTVMEKISDPLVHMIRNAVDHGLESPDEREKKGKPRAGHVTLTARNEAGEVWIIIQDDGRGLNREKIIAKAVTQGLMTEGQKILDNDLYNLIFLPGFSTAEKVTDVSGRGVGMDVVKQNISALKGRVDIQTVPDQGTTFTIKIPLTLAIIRGMMVKIGAVRYIIPIEAIRESLKLGQLKVTHPMEDQELVKIRNEMLPIIRLANIHHLPNSVIKVEDGVMVVAEAQGQRMALLVDELLGQYETVVKPLPRYFKAIKGISGCSILGNGDVCLIIDIGGLIDMVRINNDKKAHGRNTENNRPRVSSAT